MLAVASLLANLRSDREGRCAGLLPQFLALSHLNIRCDRLGADRAGRLAGVLGTLLKKTTSVLFFFEEKKEVLPLSVNNQRNDDSR